MKVRNNDYLREILNEIKELKEIARGFCKQPHILLDEYEKEQPEKRQCVQCEDEIIVKDGIIEADTFYCLPCWKVKMSKEMIEGVKKEQEQPKGGLHGIPEVMAGALEAQKKSFERMKEAKGPVNCVECHQFKFAKDCQYDIGTNTYTCFSCVDGLRKRALAEQVRKDQEAINRMTDKSSKE